VLIPCQTQPLAVMGMGALRGFIQTIQEHGNPGLSILGIVPTFYSARTTQDQATLKDIHETHGQDLHVFAPIPATTLYPQSSAGGDALIAFNAKAPGIITFEAVTDALIAERNERVAPHLGALAHG
jgi:chromosome partitioning protein